MRFEFATATRIIFGQGTISEIGPIAEAMGSRAFVVTAEATQTAQPLLQQLDQNNIEYSTFTASGEPTTTKVKSAVQEARQAGSEFVIGIGGGSAIDTGKVVAAMLTNTGQVEDYLEVVGAGQPLTERPTPYVAIPTTAGTGAEVTRNAVLGVPEHGVKVSMRSALMLPRLALVDPELTYSMPPSVTASTGLDALTQLMEVYVSNQANPLTDGLCREGLARAGRSLQMVYEQPTNSAARLDMSLASLLGGLALANAKLGAVHGFAGPLGGMISGAHGVICAALLPFVIQTNVAALQNHASNSQALARYDEVAQILTGNPNANADDGVRWVQELCEILKVEGLATLGLNESNIPEAVKKSQNSSSMKGNPILLSEEELTGILKLSL
jgi:alcohol dehydrogenase class IV